MRTVLVTGAGRGLGRAIANAYYDNNFEVIATDVDIKLLYDFKEKEHFTCLKLDITSEKECRQISAYVEEKFDKLDVLINNAGIFDFYPVSEAGSDKLKKIFDVNVFGLTNLTKYFLPHLNQSEGRLIVIGSESYKVPSPFQPYSVSKQALESVYKAIKIELSLKGNKCILIRPGAMQTKILENTIKFKRTIKNSSFNNEFDQFVETVPKYINRIVGPEKVAQLVLKAGTIKRPKSIYHVNHNPLVSIMSVLPEGIKNMIIRKSLIK